MGNLTLLRTYFIPIIFLKRSFILSHKRSTTIINGLDSGRRQSMRFQFVRLLP